MNIYCSLLNLTSEECRQLAVLIEEDGMFEATVSSCSQFWRDHLRALYPDPALCRQMFLATSLVRLAKGERKHCFSPRVLAAMLLTLADLVESRVNMPEENDVR